MNKHGTTEAGRSPGTRAHRNSVDVGFVGGWVAVDRPVDPWGRQSAWLHPTHDWVLGF